MAKRQAIPEDELFISGTDTIKSGFIDERYWPAILDSDVTVYSNEFNGGRRPALPCLT